ncbi:MAG: CpsD/CapB family tyrosine-protein kinase [Pseudomonadota bacterium]|nr:CpsD/CapB family tyrosine-protein kinase [Pseudomonadota bacterium]
MNVFERERKKPESAGEALAVLEPRAPVIATMQASEGDAMRRVWDDRGNTALFSQLRNIRREIGSLLDEKRARQRGTVILVTSAMPGEGKSFLSVGLGRVFSSGHDRRAVLVDGDLPKRHLTDAMGTRDQPGIIECLSDGRSLSDVLCRTDQPALNFIPAGRWRPDAPDLMCGTRMDRILESFRQCESRVFIVDTAPILAFGETAYLAERADLVLLIVRADRTPRAAADEALRKLAGNRPLAVVLNGQKGSVLDSYYGYGDSYGDYSPAEKK